MKKTIVLTIAGTDFSFNVTAKDHSDFIDAMARGGSVTAASYNLAMRTIDGGQKDDFKKLLDSAPGAELQIAGELKTEFAPVLEITVKK
ncbi:putative phage tail assembly chaperone [Shewanella xiamenensis]|uniref:Phage tail assembly chaperone n=1 Tax=Shewanella xiamenensis TaxID=332186 RepID=A0ABT6U6X8_9GAMM|nr:putative phage tail assembly chaperone [Shewanella xiamenensis]MDI5830205.1 putative phage tail assembly chaperone [Shewanella xiamenensis]